MTKPAIAAVILAAGKGTRMKSDLPKVMMPLCGKPMIRYPLETLEKMGVEKIVVVTAPDGDLVRQEVAPHESCIQREQLGTGHAVLCAADHIDGPFAVINADDFYGREAFRAACAFLSAPHAPNEHAMVAYRVENTLTENGSVSRGVCSERDGLLTGIVERTQIVPRPGGAAFIEDGTETFLPAGTPPPNPSELLCSARMQQMIQQLRATFDYVIFDAPPISMVTDAAVIGNQVDGALFVVRSSYAPAESVEAAVKKLKDTGVKVLGAVLTRYDAKTALKGSNYAYNYYSYGYSYGTPQTDPAASQSPEKRKHAKPAERVTNHD